MTVAIPGVEDDGFVLFTLICWICGLSEVGAPNNIVFRFLEMRKFLHYDILYSIYTLYILHILEAEVF